MSMICTSSMVMIIVVIVLLLLWRLASWTPSLLCLDIYNYR